MKSRRSPAARRSSIASGARCSCPGITYARLPPDFLGVNAVPKGFQVELLASTEAIGSDTNFTRILVSDERRFRLADKWRLQIRAEDRLKRRRRFPGTARAVPVLCGRRPERPRLRLQGTFAGRRQRQQDGRPASDHRRASNSRGTCPGISSPPFSWTPGMRSTNSAIRSNIPSASACAIACRSSASVSTWRSRFPKPDRSPRLHINFTPEF